MSASLDDDAPAPGDLRLHPVVLLAHLAQCQEAVQVRAVAHDLLQRHTIPQDCFGQSWNDLRLQLRDVQDNVTNVNVQASCPGVPVVECVVTSDETNNNFRPNTNTNNIRFSKSTEYEYE